MNEAVEAEAEEQEEEECPKCPPVGAPAWMATFADMATLLMAFFVLILSFAEFNVPKFKQISGSLKNAFGVQRVVPIVEQPKGTTVLSLNFSPSPAPSVTQDMTQQTTDITKPDLDVKAKENDQESGEAKAAEDVVKALEDAIARGDIEVEVLGENVVVNFTPTDTTDAELPNLLQETLDAIDKAKQAAGKAVIRCAFCRCSRNIKSGQIRTAKCTGGHIFSRNFDYLINFAVRGYANHTPAAIAAIPQISLAIHSRAIWKATLKAGKKTGSGANITALRVIFIDPDFVLQTITKIKKAAVISRASALPLLKATGKVKRLVAGNMDLPSV